MTDARFMHDLVVLVPDRNTEAALRALLARTESIGIARPSHTIYTHPERDPGCLRRAHEFLRPFARQYRFALVVFDHEGCGLESLSATTTENQVRSRLSENGWRDRAHAVVIEPELEAWVWSDSPHVARALGWPDGNMASLRRELGKTTFWAENAAKPNRPKETLEHVLRKTRTPRSSSIYVEIAANVSFTRCSDSSFQRLVRILKAWFAP